MTIDGDPYTVWKYHQIVEEQIELVYASKGISFTDTEYMSYYDRMITLGIIRDIKEKEAEAFSSK